MVEDSDHFKCRTVNIISTNRPDNSGDLCLL